MGILPNLARLEQGHAHQEHRDRFHDDQVHHNDQFPLQSIGEVIVVHKAFLVLWIQTINDLSFPPLGPKSRLKEPEFVHE